jgi:transposase-like protein
MKGKGHMNKRCKFTPQFKSQVVLQLLSGERSMAELCREHQLTSQMIGTWKQQFLAAATQAFASDVTNHAEQERIAELERMVGKLTMELAIAKKHRAYWMGCGTEAGGSHDPAKRLSGENHP